MNRSTCVVVLAAITACPVHSQVYVATEAEDLRRSLRLLPPLPIHRRRALRASAPPSRALEVFTDRRPSV